MIKIKKKIFFVIKSAFALVIFLTLVLFFYAAFFFDPSSIERKTVKNEIIEGEQLIEEEKVNDDAVFDVISSFPAIGKVERKSILERNIVILPLISLLLFLIGLILVNTFKFIKEYE